MRQYIIHIISFVAFGFIFGSCEQEYLIDTSDFEKQLVVNSVFTHDKPWLVSVTNSVNILDNDEEIGPVVDAKVEIYDQDGEHLYNLIPDENGDFNNGEEAPSYGRCYNIIVSAPGYKSVYAKDQVPEEGELTINKRNIKDEQGNVVDTEISFFIGKSDEETFLVWELYDEEEIGESGIPEGERNLTNSWLKQLTKNPKSVIYESDVKVGKTINGNVTTTLGTLLDIDDGGKFIELGPGLTGSTNEGTDQVDVSGYTSLIVDGEEEDEESNGDNSEEGEETKPQYELRVMTISKDLHGYFKSVEEYYRFNPNSTLVPPSKVHSNVSNSLGIFAGYHEQVVTF